LLSKQDFQDANPTDLNKTTTPYMQTITFLYSTVNLKNLKQDAENLKCQQTSWAVCL